MNNFSFEYNNSLVQKAFIFANQKHTEINHRRKYTNDPYIVHPIAVAKIVSSVRHTPEMIAAALLHDTLEDTYTSKEELFFHFGSVVTLYVDQLTDVSTSKDGNRKKRKDIDRLHLATAEPAVQTIKLADLIDNTATIVLYDKKFAKVYLEEKEYLLTVLMKGDSQLFHQACSILIDAKNQLK